MTTNFHSRSFVQRASNHGLIFRKDDPKSYGFICPHCLARYGSAEKNYRREIEIVRCKDCPPFSMKVLEKSSHDEAKRRAKYKRTGQ